MGKQFKNTESSRDWDDYGDPGSVQREVLSLKSITFEDVKAMGTDKKIADKIMKALSLSNC